jgi:hypothetical protein
MVHLNSALRLTLTVAAIASVFGESSALSAMSTSGLIFRGPPTLSRDFVKLAAAYPIVAVK